MNYTVTILYTHDDCKGMGVWSGRAGDLGVHEETIRRWAREGAIPAVKLGNRGGFRFRREDLDRFLAARHHTE